MAGSERPTPVPRAPRQGRLAPQHARVPAQRHSPTHVHVLAHVQQAIHELGRELLSLSPLCPLSPSSVALPRSPFSDPRIPEFSLSLRATSVRPLSSSSCIFARVSYEVYFINAPRFFWQPKLLASFYGFTRADGLNNTGEAVLLSFG